MPTIPLLLALGVLRAMPVRTVSIAPIAPNREVLAGFANEIEASSDQGTAGRSRKQ